MRAQNSKGVENRGQVKHRQRIRRKKPTIELLEDRRLLTAASLVLDFTPDYDPSEWNVGGFREVFETHSSAIRLLDYDGNSVVDADDANIAAGRIATQVRLLLKPFGTEGLRVLNRRFAPATNEDLFSGFQLLEDGIASSSKDVFVIFVGNTHPSREIFGIAKQADIAFRNEFYGYAFAGATADYLLSGNYTSVEFLKPEHFTQFVARTIAHEFAHLMGIGHVYAVPPSDTNSDGRAENGVRPRGFNDVMNYVPYVDPALAVFGAKPNPGIFVEQFSNGQTIKDYDDLLGTDESLREALIVSTTVVPETRYSGERFTSSPDEEILPEQLPIPQVDAPQASNGSVGFTQPDDVWSTLANGFNEFASSASLTFSESLTSEANAIPLVPSDALTQLRIGDSLRALFGQLPLPTKNTMSDIVAELERHGFTVTSFISDDDFVALQSAQAADFIRASRTYRMSELSTFVTADLTDLQSIAGFGNSSLLGSLVVRATGFVTVAFGVDTNGFYLLPGNGVFADFTATGQLGGVVGTTQADGTMSFSVANDVRLQTVVADGRVRLSDVSKSASVMSQLIGSAGANIGFAAQLGPSEPISLDGRWIWQIDSKSETGHSLSTVDSGFDTEGLASQLVDTLGDQLPYAIQTLSRHKADLTSVPMVGRLLENTIDLFSNQHLEYGNEWDTFFEYFSSRGIQLKTVISPEQVIQGVSGNDTLLELRIDSSLPFSDLHFSDVSHTVGTSDVILHIQSTLPETADINSQLIVGIDTSGGAYIQEGSQIAASWSGVAEMSGSAQLGSEYRGSLFGNVSFEQVELSLAIDDNDAFSGERLYFGDFVENPPPANNLEIQTGVSGRIGLDEIRIAMDLPIDVETLPSVTLVASGNVDLASGEVAFAFGNDALANAVLDVVYASLVELSIQAKDLARSVEVLPLIGRQLAPKIGTSFSSALTFERLTPGDFRTQLESLGFTIDSNGVATIDDLLSNTVGAKPILKLRYVDMTDIPEFTDEFTFLSSQLRATGAITLAPTVESDFVLGVDLVGGAYIDEGAKFSVELPATGELSGKVDIGRLGPLNARAIADIDVRAQAVLDNGNESLNEHLYLFGSDTAYPTILSNLYENGLRTDVSGTATFVVEVELDNPLDRFGLGDIVGDLSDFLPPELVSSFVFSGTVDVDLENAAVNLTISQDSKDRFAAIFDGDVEQRFTDALLNGLLDRLQVNNPIPTEVAQLLFYKIPVVNVSLADELGIPDEARILLDPAGWRDDYLAASGNGEPDQEGDGSRIDFTIDLFHDGNILKLLDGEDADLISVNIEQHFEPHFDEITVVPDTLLFTWLGIFSASFNIGLTPHVEFGADVTIGLDTSGFYVREGSAIQSNLQIGGGLDANINIDGWLTALRALRVTGTAGVNAVIGMYFADQDDVSSKLRPAQVLDLNNQVLTASLNLHLGLRAVAGALDAGLQAELADEEWLIPLWSQEGGTVADIRDQLQSFKDRMRENAEKYVCAAAALGDPFAAAACGANAVKSISEAIQDGVQSAKEAANHAIAVSLQLGRDIDENIRDIATNVQESVNSFRRDYLEPLIEGTPIAEIVNHVELPYLGSWETVNVPNRHSFSAEVIDGVLVISNWDTSFADARFGRPGAEITIGLVDGRVVADGPDFAESELVARKKVSRLLSSSYEERREEVTHSNAYEFAAAGINSIRVVGTGFNDRIIVTSSIEIATDIDGSDGDDVLVGGSGTNLIVGGGGNDFVQGGDANDLLVGGDGDDVVFGKGGDDTIFGWISDTTNTGNPNGDGHDILDGGDGDDTLWGYAGNDVLRGGMGADLMHGEDGDDTLEGNDGDDTIFGGNGADSVFGDDGNDKLYGEGGKDIIIGGFGDDTLLGGDDDDVVYGDQISDPYGGSDFVFGNAGNDRLFGGGDSDFIIGGAGADLISGDDGDDLIYGGMCSDNLFLSAVSDQQGPWESDEGDVIVGGWGRDEIHGGAGDDTISGEADADVVYGDDGNDEIQGGDGDDQLYGGDGNDVIAGNSGQDVLIGETGNDTLIASRSNGFSTEEFLSAFDPLAQEATALRYEGGLGSVVVGGPGDDQVYGSDGDDMIWAGDGNDLVYGGRGNDEITGGAGNDRLFGEWPSAFDAPTDEMQYNDKIFGGGPNDLEQLNTDLRQDDGVNTIEGGPGNDVITAGQLGDSIHGGFGRDQIWGGIGNDTLFGDEDDDMLHGMDGTDLIYGDGVVFGGSDGVDTIAGGPGTDTIYGGSLGDLILGDDLINEATDGDDIIFGDYLAQSENDGNDWIFAGGGDDNAEGGGGDDTIVGDLGHDTLFGGGGRDLIWGGLDIFTRETMFAAGFDNDGISPLVALDETYANLLGGSDEDGENAIHGGQGDDWLFGGGQRDQLFGDGGNDYVFGAPGSDVIHGGIGNDTLTANDGDDTVYGDSGDDRISGGAGRDSIDPGPGNNVLLDFSDEDYLLTRTADYSGNGIVDAADYTIWKDSFGSLTQLVADGNGNGIVDAADYTIWKDHFGEVATVAPVLPGDYNGNSHIDAADYTIWKDAFGSRSDSRADGNANGLVDAADYTIWKDNFGAQRTTSEAVSDVSFYKTYRNRLSPNSQRSVSRLTTSTSVGSLAGTLSEVNETSDAIRNVIKVSLPETIVSNFPPLLHLLASGNLGFPVALADIRNAIVDQYKSSIENAIRLTTSATPNSNARNFPSCSANFHKLFTSAEPFLRQNRWDIIDSEVTDLNDDGYLDLVGIDYSDPFDAKLVTLLGGQNAVFQDLGQAQPIGVDGFRTVSMATGDITNDGRVDVLVSSRGSTLLFQNVGNGLLGAPVALPFTSTSLGINDLDGDGLADIVSGAEYDFIGVAYGTIEGKYDTVDRYSLISPTSPIGGDSTFLVDINGDGMIDIVAGRTTFSSFAPSGEVIVLLNQGDRRFMEAPEVVMGNWGREPMVLTTADINLDGNLDLISLFFEPRGIYGGGLITIALGNGDGTFESTIAIDLLADQDAYLPSGGIAIIDYDGNGPLDILVPRSSAQISVLLGSTEMQYQETISPFGPYPLTGESTIADIDNDGHSDVVFGGTVLLARNDFSTLELLYRTRANLSHPYPIFPVRREFVPTDINHDGFEDFIVSVDTSNGVGYAELVMGRDDGTYYKTSISNSPPVTTTSRAFVVGDFNGDGEEDVIDGDGLYFGLGDGSFGPRITAPHQFFYYQTVATDVNADGKDDIVAAQLGQLLIYLSLGDGQFEYVDTAIDLGISGRFAVGDINLDGWTDIVIATLDDQPTLSAYINSPGDGFIPGAAVMFDDQIVTFELGDLDGDSRPELIVLTVDINKDKPERIRIFNISDGGELLERQIVDLASPLYWSLNIVDIKVMDLNNDCQPEVVVVPKGSGRSMYYIISTDPFGYLEDVAAFTTDYYTRDAEFADVDRDGDLDLVVLTDDGLWVIRNHLN